MGEQVRAADKTMHDMTSRKRLGGERILLVGDEEHVRGILSMSLVEIGGATVVEAENGAQALEPYQAGRFTCVVTHLSMPEMRGDEMARKIRAMSASQRIVMLSGFAGEVLQNGRLPEFIDLLLSKPCSLEEMMNAIQPPAGNQGAPQT